jgi:hypothetical protein
MSIMLLIATELVLVPRNDAMDQSRQFRIAEKQRAFAPSDHGEAVTDLPVEA